MISFKKLPTFKEEFTQKIVCDVKEYTQLIDDKKFKLWAGSTEEEYFQIIFIQGCLSISISEKECDISKTVNQVAIDRRIHNELSGRKLKISLKEYMNQYERDGLSNDLTAVTFKDVMKLLKWKFKSRDVKVKVDTFWLT